MSYQTIQLREEQFIDMIGMISNATSLGDLEWKEGSSPLESCDISECICYVSEGSEGENIYIVKLIHDIKIEFVWIWKSSYKYIYEYNLDEDQNNYIYIKVQDLMSTIQKYI